MFVLYDIVLVTDMVCCWRWPRVRLLCRFLAVSRHDHHQTLHRWCTRGTCSL